MQKRRYRNRVRHPRFDIGQHVRYSEGPESGTGVVEAATDDWAIVWLWTDCGKGRRMLLQGMGAIVAPIDEGAGKAVSD
ncbi:hypothetical protein [Pseudarthrobacter sp. NamE2]|uniref:hypothetical protein n=1 Tax=Pseudarthrobacter sp. NamE2 TaxID=2576838 RepID=UPI001F10355B|nr:hypothetical protein [Pseudarthrobacter sp. NamE2]